MALQNRMRCSKNRLPILLKSKTESDDRYSKSDVRFQNRTTNTEKLDDWFLYKRGEQRYKTGFPIKLSEQWMSLTHKNNLISHSRFSPSQATQACSQPRMATNGGSLRRIHREQTVIEE
ncbi:hypothetical protein M9H77_28211 [Catharanthus roseus]|uniref:Uncharacterized protein n=1 Tax=Catharanthus roseus TaxID=4058 RepID=A0ACC0AHE1_CATRO|nr:hypothetical protein M9H77_28211 [Catharanthus roseus]